jgi:ABC-2 type transport system permease protein
MTATVPTIGTAGRGIDRRRLWGFVRKEWLQILRDPSSIIVAVVLPLFLLFLFGYGVSLDAKHLPVAVVIETSAPEAHDFYASLRATNYLVPQRAESRSAAAALLRAGKVSGIAILPDDFGARLGSNGTAPIQVLVNGTDANTARIMQGYIQGAWGAWKAQRAHMDPKTTIAPAIVVQSRVWFNETLDSHKSIVPGLIAVIMTLIGALLTALVIAREWERGTMEALLTTPLTIAELIVGKLIPYFTLGMVGMVVSVTVALVLFRIGFEGSFLLLFAASALFMLVVLGFGLMVSTLTRNQFAASIVAITGTMMPALLLSGFIFDLRSMPLAIQIVSFVVPGRYFVETLKTLFLAGNIWSVVLPNMAALATMAALFLGITFRATRRKIA